VYILKIRIVAVCSEPHWIFCLIKSLQRCASNRVWLNVRSNYAFESEFTEWFNTFSDGNISVKLRSSPKFSFRCDFMVVRKPYEKLEIKSMFSSIDRLGKITFAFLQHFKTYRTYETSRRENVKSCVPPPSQSLYDKCTAKRKRLK
jgi:hypothetical protein